VPFCDQNLIQDELQVVPDEFDHVTSPPITGRSSARRRFVPLSQ
jgi:hypothetical protein